MNEVIGIMLLGGALLVFSILASVLSNRLGAPLLLVFLCIGMLAGEDGILGVEFDNPQLSFFIGSLALAIILFDGGMRTHKERFRVALWPAISLSTLGVALTCTITAAGAVWLFELPWPTALLIGALLSSTDAAAVFGIFQSRGVTLKQRVASTLEIESGTNDPMAVILTMTLTTALATGASLDLLSLGTDVLWQLVIGLIAGWLGGQAFIQLVRRIPLDFTFVPLLAAASAILVFSLTAKANASGFLAVYLMGYLIGNARLPQIVHILQVQDGLTWLGQILMFLILGLLVTPSHLMDNAALSLSIALILIFVARPIATLVCLLPFAFPWREQLFISWVGLRGAVPIILALYPWLSGLEDQALYFDVAFFVVLISLLVQGWTMTPLARWLGLEVPPTPEPTQRLPLETLPSGDPLEVWAFPINKDSLAFEHRWEELSFTHQPCFVGIIRNHAWIQAEHTQQFVEGDCVLVMGRAADMDSVSRVLASSDKARQLQESDFFGAFSLHASLSLGEVAQFYPLGELTQEKAALSLSDFFARKFHRRVVVGDYLHVGSVTLTVRQVDSNGNIESVGIKES
ncbi:potassium/proton antiporter [Bowmanella yangjiangensis]|uniref:Potassium/proton antiporter n=1 Tax=Bowmanella yangjiangensis TaxID=2811230 RepID=A0ABS3CTZ2_9ALTE|nr:potassium/proton antiporter [Bowmanella yangjiangensis]MBN7819896.1 potassium/proton antiporter [Bowmanella yangjiangensis]